jgi:hypothetical protein
VRLPFDDVGVYSLSGFDDVARIRLWRLDRLLDHLEELNLRDRKRVSTRVGIALQDVGIENPQARSVSELMDRVFELQEPLLKMMGTRPHRRRN